MGDLASDRLAIASYVQEGDFDGAFSLAQTLPSLYGLEGNRGSMVVDLHELPASVYFFVITDQSGRTSSSKIAKK